MCAWKRMYAASYIEQYTNLLQSIECIVVAFYRHSTIQLLLFFGLLVWYMQQWSMQRATCAIALKYKLNHVQMLPILVYTYGGDGDGLHWGIFVRRLFEQPKTSSRFNDYGLQHVVVEKTIDQF